MNTHRVWSFLISHSQKKDPRSMTIGQFSLYFQDYAHPLIYFFAGLHQNESLRHKIPQSDSYRDAKPRCDGGCTRAGQI